MTTILRGSDNFDTSSLPAPTTAQVLAATAGASVGAVGTYIIAQATSGGASGTTYYGSTWSGSSMAACNVGQQGSTYSQSGTWRIMGTMYWGGSGQGYVTVWLRIA